MHGFRILTIAAMVAASFAARSASAAPLRVCATTPDLASLVREIGGEAVDLTVFAKGTEDPHFVEPRPSFVRALADADLLVLNGMDLETGWLPVLYKNARNGNVLPGAAGYLDASTAIDPLEVPTTTVDRSRGDIHPYGNPHYLLDPLNGLRVATLLRDRLADLQPEDRAGFEARLDAFRKRLGDALVGSGLSARYDAVKLARLHEHGKLLDFLEEQGKSDLLGGWIEAVAGLHGELAVADHNLWPYFSRRFGLRMVGFLEPRPGIPPTTTHLRELVETMRKRDVRLILAATYYDPRHADFLATNTDAALARMANQVGARSDTGDYLATIDHNVRQIVAARKESGS